MADHGQEILQHHRAELFPAAKGEPVKFLQTIMGMYAEKFSKDA